MENAAIPVTAVHCLKKSILAESRMPALAAAAATPAAAQASPPVQAMPPITPPSKLSPLVTPATAALPNVADTPAARAASAGGTQAFMVANPNNVVPIAITPAAVPAPIVAASPAVPVDPNAALIPDERNPETNIGITGRVEKKSAALL